MTPATGWAHGHHGEILQGTFGLPGGPVPALITVPAPSLTSTATFTPAPVPGVRAHPGREKSRRAAELTLDHLRRTAARRGLDPVAIPTGGALSVDSRIEAGLGLGSSTADAVASVRAVAGSVGAPLSPGEIAGIAVAAEGASDPVMCCTPGTVALFAHREGRVLRRWPRPLPPMLLVGCRCGGPVETDALHAAAPPPTRRQIARHNRLLADLDRAIADGDARAVGRVATASALANQRLNPTPHIQVLLDICADCGGAGVQVAHSGGVAGVLLPVDPRSPSPSLSRARACRSALSACGLAPTLTESIGDHRPRTRHRPVHARQPGRRPA